MNFDAFLAFPFPIGIYIGLGGLIILMMMAMKRTTYRINIGVMWGLLSMILAYVLLSIEYAAGSPMIPMEFDPLDPIRLVDQKGQPVLATIICTFFLGFQFAASDEARDDSWLFVFLIWVVGGIILLPILLITFGSEANTSLGFGFMRSVLVFLIGMTIVVYGPTFLRLGPSKESE